MKRELCAIVILCSVAGSVQGAASLAEAAAKERVRRAELHKKGVESTVVDNIALEKYKATKLVEINFSPAPAAGKARRPSRGSARAQSPSDIEQIKAEREERLQVQDRADYLDERLGSSSPLVAAGTSLSEGEKRSYGRTYAERKATAKGASGRTRSSARER